MIILSLVIVWEGMMYITDKIQYVGVDDTTIDLFESQYQVPYGVSYNSYVILDEKIAIMDTVDGRKTKEWITNVKQVLGDRQPDYLIVSHLEPDHAGSLQEICNHYPAMKLVGNATTFRMIPQFFTLEFDSREVLIEEADELLLGESTLQFFMAPMVHWPEVMVTYEKNSRVLFSADGFGTFGALESESEWIEEARRYYINIVGKYGAATSALLKKAATLDIHIICPLHGPILNENLEYYIDKYATWSSYEPEESGIVVAYASMHGNTAVAAREFADIASRRGNLVLVIDLSRDDMSVAVEKAFQYDRLVLACATYDAGLFPVMADYINHLRAKNYQKRTVGLIENGSWAPVAAKKMAEMLDGLKDIRICKTVVSIQSVMKTKNEEHMRKLIEEMK